jgi:hypothetical protein
LGGKLPERFGRRPARNIKLYPSGRSPPDLGQGGESEGAERHEDEAKEVVAAAKTAGPAATMDPRVGNEYDGVGRRTL